MITIDRVDALATVIKIAAKRAGCKIVADVRSDESVEREVELDLIDHTGARIWVLITHDQMYDPGPHVGWPEAKEVKE